MVRVVTDQWHSVETKPAGNNEALLQHLGRESATSEARQDAVANAAAFCRKKRVELVPDRDPTNDVARRHRHQESFRDKLVW